MSDLDKQAYARVIARQNQSRDEPRGTWRQRWIPSVCNHTEVRCVHGDEIIARRWRRRVCRICGRALSGSLPGRCWFTGQLHGSVEETHGDTP